VLDSIKNIEVAEELKTAKDKETAEDKGTEKDKGTAEDNGNAINQATELYKRCIATIDSQRLYLENE
jgi:hypothetical protein